MLPPKFITEEQHVDVCVSSSIPRNEFPDTRLLNKTYLCCLSKGGLFIRPEIHGLQQLIFTHITRWAIIDKIYLMLVLLLNLHSYLKHCPGLSAGEGSLDPGSAHVGGRPAWLFRRGSCPQKPLGLWVGKRRCGE